MKNLRFQNETFLKYKNKNDYTTHVCCAVVSESDFCDYYDSILIPVYFFESKKVSLIDLQNFVNNFSELSENKYKDEIKIINSKDMHYNAYYNFSQVNLDLIKEDLVFNLEICYFDNKSRKPKHFDISKKLNELFDLNFIHNYIKEIYSKNTNLSTDKITKFLRTSTRTLDNQSFLKSIKDKSLSDFISKKRTDNSYVISCSIYLPDEIMELDNYSLLKDNILFYNIPFKIKSFSKQNAWVVRFLLLNILRTYQTGYNIDLIKLYNNIKLNHPEIKLFTETCYLLFTCQAVSAYIQNYTSIANNETLDINDEFNILEVYESSEGADLCKFNKINKFKNNVKSIRLQLSDSYINTEEEDDEYDDYIGEENINCINVSNAKLKIVYSSLLKNDITQLLKTIKWI